MTPSIDRQHVGLAASAAGFGVESAVRTSIQDSSGKTFAVVPVTSPEALADLPDAIKLDGRIKKEDSEHRLSCFKGVALDSQFTRAQIFLIKDGLLCIGIATLFVIPYRHVSKDIYFTRVGDKLVTQPFTESFQMNPGSFLIETGWLQILPEYRNKNLGKAILEQVLIPTIESLCSQSREEVIVRCSALGRAEGVLRERMRQIAGDFFSKGVTAIDVTAEIEPLLGQEHADALFTSSQARKMQLNSLPGLFNISLGPVFAAKIAQGGQG